MFAEGGRSCSRCCPKATSLQAALFRAVAAAVSAAVLSTGGPLCAATSIEELTTLAESAKDQFTPITDETVAEARGDLLEAAEQLDGRLFLDGENGQNWREFVMLGEVIRQLEGDSPDLGVLDKSFVRLSSGHEGLNYYWFSNLRDELRGYLTIVRSKETPNLDAAYAGLLDSLIVRLKAYDETAAAADRLAVALGMQWLGDAGQADELRSALAETFHQPNLLVEVSESFVASGMARDVDRVGPLRDCILGTSIYGTTHTVGRINIDFRPSQDEALVALNFSGRATSNSVGYNGPVKIYSTSQTALASTTQLSVGDWTMSASPTYASADVDTRYNGFEATRGGALVERIARRRAYKSKAEAECIAASHAERDLRRETDAEVADAVAEANTYMGDELRRPLRLRRMEPQEFLISSTEHAIVVGALQSGTTGLAAPSPAPGGIAAVDGDPAGPDVVARVHESFLNNSLQEALAGMRVSEDRLRREIEDVFGEIPEALQPSDEPEFTITFASQAPMMVDFRDNTLAMTISGAAFKRGDSTYPAMNITAEYEIGTVDNVISLVRRGALKIFPPGFDPEGKERLSAGQQVLRTLLESRLENVFRPEWVADPIDMPEEWKAVGAIRLVSASAEDGWLSLGFKSSQ